MCFLTDSWEFFINCQLRLGNCVWVSCGIYQRKRRILAWISNWVPLHCVTKLSLQVLRDKILFQSGQFEYGLTLRRRARLWTQDIIIIIIIIISDLYGTVKVILSFFRHGEESAFKRHRNRISISCQKHHYLQDKKKHLTDLLGFREQARNMALKCTKSNFIDWQNPVQDNQRATQS